MPDKILCAKWSPSEEFLILVTSKFVVLLDPQLNPQKEVPIDDIESEKPTEANSACVSWAADGKLFAVCFSCDSKSKCLQRDLSMKIIKGPAKADPEGGIVQSVSEKLVPNLLDIIAVMPSGGYVVGIELPKTETMPKKAILWEKNGLRHGEFELPKDCGIIREIGWTLDGSVLAISDFTKDSTTIIRFYQRMNYKWYCKNVIKINEPNINSFKWLSKKGKLLVVRNSGYTSIYEIEQMITGSTHRLQNEKDFAGVAVTDFNSLYISHFDKTVIPPPMSNYKVDIPNGFYQIKLCYSEHYLACLSYDSLLFYHVKANYTKTSIFKFIGDHAKLANLLVQFGCTNFLILEHTENEIHAILTIPTFDNDTILLNFKITDFSADSLKISDFNELKISKQRISSICPNSLYLSKQPNIEHNPHNAYFPMHLSDEELTKSPYILLQLSDKSFSKFHYEDPKSSLSEFPLNVSQVFTQICASFIGNSEGIIGLTSNMKLYINSILFSADVTSFLVSGNLLFFTKSTPGTSHLLYCFDLTNGLPTVNVFF